MLLYLLSINQNIMHVFIMCHFYDTSTWCHKVDSKYVGNVCFCSNICYHFAKDIVFFISRYTICVYHNYREILYHDILSITIIVALVLLIYTLSIVRWFSHAHVICAPLSSSLSYTSQKRFKVRGCISFRRELH